MKQIASVSVFLKPSRRLQIVQVVAHGVAVGAVLAAAIPSWLAAVLLLLVGASLARLRRAPRVAGLILRGDGGVETVGVDGAANEAAVHPHSLVLSFLVVLLYRQQGRLRSLTVLADSLAADDFRQLRLWLRWRSNATDLA